MSEAHGLRRLEGVDISQLQFKKGLECLRLILRRLTLRQRLLAGILIISALGMIGLAAATYIEERGFLYSRLDAQLLLAPRQVTATLSKEGIFPYGTPEPNPATNLPQGSYGELRTLQGQILQRVYYSYGQKETGPNLPSNIPLGRIFSVSGYLVLAEPVGQGLLGPESGELLLPTQPLIAVAALPTSDTTSTLDQLLFIESIVVLVVLALIATLSLLVVRLGLSPLRRFAGTAEEISSGNLEKRLEEPGGRSEIQDLATSFNVMIDHLHQALDAQGQALKEKEASEERLRRFVADASHELRTPLTSILGYAQLWRIGGLKDRAKQDEAIKSIEKEAVRMTALVKDLLALAKLDQKPSIARESFDLGAVVLDVLQDARRRFPERELVFELVEAGSAKNGDSPVMSLGDKEASRRIVINLVENACQHGQGKVTVVLRVDKNKVILEVFDEGPGIPEPPERAFERFWRASAGREREGGGTGLGLAIAKELTEGQGGGISVENVPGSGAHFIVSLPLAE